MKILLIYRAEQFSPNSVEKDRAILDAVGTKLVAAGHQVDAIGEQQLTHVDGYDWVMTMGRLPETLEKLQSKAGVINTSAAIRNCGRCQLATIMQLSDTPVPPQEGSHGYWLKRGDAAAQSKDDVQYVADKTELAAKIAAFEQRGITAYTVSAHVPGDLVKFYGVSGSGFFRYYYPTDDGDTKFGDEARNGSARHYPFQEVVLQHTAETLAQAVGIQVYGGDCIVREDGSFCVIDFNDWPSFSRCRDEAAEAIAGLVNSD